MHTWLSLKGDSYENTDRNCQSNKAALFLFLETIIPESLSLTGETR